MIMWKISPYFLNQKMTTHELNVWNNELYGFLNDFKIMGIKAVFITGFLNGILIRAHHHDDVMMVVGYMKIIKNELHELYKLHCNNEYKLHCNNEYNNECGGHTHCSPYDTIPICCSNLSQ